MAIYIYIFMYSGLMINEPTQNWGAPPQNLCAFLILSRHTIKGFRSVIHTLENWAWGASFGCWKLLTSCHLVQKIEGFTVPGRKIIKHEGYNQQRWEDDGTTGKKWELIKHWMQWGTLCYPIGKGL